MLSIYVATCSSVLKTHNSICLNLQSAFNSIYAGLVPCILVDILLSNFSRINVEIEKLRRQEKEINLALEAQEAINKAALAEMRALFAKL
jgi:hypothetical protein